MQGNQSTVVTQEEMDELLKGPDLVFPYYSPLFQRRLPDLIVECGRCGRDLRTFIGRADEFSQTKTVEFRFLAVCNACHMISPPFKVRWLPLQSDRIQHIASGDAWTETDRRQASFVKRLKWQFYAARVWMETLLAGPGREGRKS
jgi:hypothetical protein